VQIYTFLDKCTAQLAIIVFCLAVMRRYFLGIHFCYGRRTNSGSTANSAVPMGYYSAPVIVYVAGPGTIRRRAGATSHTKKAIFVRMVDQKGNETRKNGYFRVSGCPQTGRNQPALEGKAYTNLDLGAGSGPILNLGEVEKAVVVAHDYLDVAGLDTNTAAKVDVEGIAYSAFIDGGDFFVVRAVHFSVEVVQRVLSGSLDI
jgi:hypothetical protein